MKPAGSTMRTTSLRSRLSGGSRSASGISHQSTSPVCSAAAIVPPSGMIFHSTRSKCATFGPAVPLGVPSLRGT